MIIHHLMKKIRKKIRKLKSHFLKYFLNLKY